MITITIANQIAGMPLRFLLQKERVDEEVFTFSKSIGPNRLLDHMIG